MSDKSKIFIVEDDETIVKLLSNYLSANYEVARVINFRDVLREIQAFQPDLVLMDITLPYFNGFYWTTELRKTEKMPIIFISSADDEMNAIMAMNMGGDDFVSKPFSLAILDAKIAAFLRRANDFSQQCLTYASYQLTPDGQIFEQTTGRATQLTPTETKIMTLLLRNKEEVVTKDDLLDELWEGEEFIDQNTLSVNLTRLRKKLAKIDFNKIHTIRGVGYIIK